MLVQPKAGFLCTRGSATACHTVSLDYKFYCIGNNCEIFGADLRPKGVPCQHTPSLPTSNSPFRIIVLVLVTILAGIGGNPSPKCTAGVLAASSVSPNPFSKFTTDMAMLSGPLSGPFKKSTITSEKFDEVKTTFLQKVGNFAKNHTIPADLVINWDQTGIFPPPTT